jgi:hypothetical protein
MNRTRNLITTGGVLLLTLLFAGPLAAQTDFTVVRGEVRLRRGSSNLVDSLTCGPASSRNNDFYSLYSNEEATLKFSFGRRDRDRTTIGSWAIRRRALRGTLIHPSLIMDGSFTDGNVSLPGSLRPLPPPGYFLLIGQTTHADGRCFPMAPARDIRITGSCVRPTDGINLVVVTGTEIYARGTFSGVVSVSCGRGPASDVDRTLNRGP